MIQGERDSWVQAINKLCMNWKRCSQSEPMYKDLKELRESRAVTGVLQQSEDGTLSYSLLLSEESDGEESSAPTGVRAFPLPPIPPLAKPSNPELLPTTPPPSPLYSALQPKVPPPPPVPAPPPLPRKQKLPKQRTKAFHWDLVAQDKVTSLLLLILTESQNQESSLGMLSLHTMSVLFFNSSVQLQICFSNKYHYCYDMAKLVQNISPMCKSGGVHTMTGIVNTTNGSSCKWHHAREISLFSWNWSYNTWGPWK